MDRKLPTKRAIPLYRQLTNSCGLASVLMLLDPNNDKELHNYLKIIAKLISPLIERINFIKEKEFIYQYVLQYILLKALSQDAADYNFLYDYLEAKFPGLYKNHKLISNYNLKKKHKNFIRNEMFSIAKAYDRYILEGDIIPPLILKNETYSVKNDFELKILFSLFGYDFVAFDSINGALVYKKKDKDFLDKLLRSYINPSNKILFGDGLHWQALVGIYPKDLKKWVIKDEKIAPKTSLKDYMIVYNDPIIPKENIIQLKELLYKQRFYIFKRKQKSNLEIWNQIRSAISRDVPEELDETFDNKNNRTDNKFYKDVLMRDDELF